MHGSSIITLPLKSIIQNELKYDTDFMQKKIQTLGSEDEDRLTLLSETEQAEN